MDGESVLGKTAAGGPQGPGLLGAAPAWEFRWVDEGAPEQSAHVIGQLRWRGFDIAFAVDGLLGVDGRLAAPSLSTMPPDLQQLVLQHFADECLQTFQGSPLADGTLTSLQWHEDPLPMEGEFEFTLRRAGLPRSSRGRLTVFHEAGRLQLLNALASLGWDLPAGLSTVNGRLRIGSARLTPDECAGLEVGDLVWLDDAEVAPSGLRAQFLPTDEADAACSVRIKRHAMSKERVAAVARDPAAGGEPGVVVLNASSAEMAVQRAWLQGTLPQQLLAQTALALTWRLGDEGQPARCEGQLRVVGRRLGLRVTQRL